MQTAKNKRPQFVLVAFMMFFGVILCDILRDYGFWRWLFLIATALYYVVGFLARYFEVFATIKSNTDKIIPAITKWIIPSHMRRTGKIVKPPDWPMEDLKRKLLEKVEVRCKAILDHYLIVRVQSASKARCCFDQEVLACNDYDGARERSDHAMKNAKYELKQKDGLRGQYIKIGVVGEPGQGKTRYLAEWIIEECEQLHKKNSGHDFPDKVPVLISLRNWSSDTILSIEEMADWLADAFEKQYEEQNADPTQSLDAGTIRIMINKGCILPFLDGLDEVREDLRLVCLGSIIALPGNFSNAVFSCRYKEFNPLLKRVDDEMNLPEQERKRLKVYHLQEVDKQVVQSMIEATQENALDIMHYIEKNDIVLEYINKPLYYNLFILSFKKLSQVKSDKGGFERSMWREYENVMFKEKGKIVKRRTNARTGAVATVAHPEKELVDQDANIHLRNYLLVLSQKLDVNNNAFFIDRLQPAWLGSKGAITLYYLISRIVSGMLLSVAIGFFIAGPLDFIGVGIVSSVIVAFLTIWINHLEVKYKWLKWASVIIFPISLIIITGLYQGFSVPRDTLHDMKGAFSRTEALSGILLGLFFGIIFGFRKIDQSAIDDIKPVHNSVFKWNQALRTGLRGGFLIGLFIAIAGYIIYEISAAPTFNRWFKSTIGGLVQSVEEKLHVAGWMSKEFTLVFLFPLVVGTYVAFLIFAIIGGRAKDVKKGTVAVDPDANLNDGIIRSMWCSIKYGASVFFLVFLLYGLFVWLLSGNTEGMVRAAQIGIGMALISYLWYGGFEYIQHWSLRFCLYGHGILPWNFNTWAGNVQKLTFVVRTGQSLQFFHSKLKDYYDHLAKEKQPAIVLESHKNKRRMLRYFSWVFFSISILLASIPFVLRFASFGGWHYYWQQPHRIIHRLKPQPWQILNDSTLIVRNSDTFFLHITGKVHVGTFTGSTYYRGTNTGLLGFPLGSVYNIDSAFRHGALLYKKNNGKWSYMTDSVYFTDSSSGSSTVDHYMKKANRLMIQHGLFAGKDVIRLRLQVHDTLHFRINDNEHQNNSGCFRLIIDSTTGNAKHSKN
jgi:hypothetical protein